MMRFLDSTLFERLMFTAVLVGIVLGLISIIRIVDVSIRLNDNPAAQIHRNGEELDIQSTAEGRGLVAADLEYRRLVKTRWQMFTVGGVGLVFIGIGWLGYDLLRSRRGRKVQGDESMTHTESAQT